MLALGLLLCAASRTTARGFQLFSTLTWAHPGLPGAQGKDNEFVVAPKNLGAQGKIDFDFYSDNLIDLDTHTMDGDKLHGQAIDDIDSNVPGAEHPSFSDTIHGPGNICSHFFQKQNFKT